MSQFILKLQFFALCMHSFEAGCCCGFSRQFEIVKRAAKNCDGAEAFRLKFVRNLAVKPVVLLPPFMCQQGMLSGKNLGLPFYAIDDR